MPKGLNEARLIGHLGSDPVLKYLESGIAVCNFSVATSSKFKNKNDKYETRTEWHRIVAWAKLAEICGEYLKKGKQVYIGGRLQTRSWVTDDVKKYTTEIVADEMLMLGSKEDAPQATEAPAPQPEKAQEEDDLPF